MILVGVKPRAAVSGDVTRASYLAHGRTQNRTHFPCLGHSRTSDRDGDVYPDMPGSVKALGTSEGQTCVLQSDPSHCLTVISSDRIEATVDRSKEQAILEDNHPLLQVDAIGCLDPDAGKHVSLIVRLQELWTAG